jgi:hypothetical protein
MPKSSALGRLGQDHFNFKASLGYKARPCQEIKRDGREGGRKEGRREGRKEGNKLCHRKRVHCQGQSTCILSGSSFSYPV